MTDENIAKIYESQITLKKKKKEGIYGNKKNNIIKSVILLKPFCL